MPNGDNVEENGESIRAITVEGAHEVAASSVGDKYSMCQTKSKITGYGIHMLVYS